LQKADFLFTELDCRLCSELNQQMKHAVCFQKGRNSWRWEIQYYYPIL